MEPRQNFGGLKNRQFWYRAKDPPQDGRAEKPTRLWKASEAPGGEGKENFATILRLQKLGRSPWCCDMRAEAWRSEDGDRMEHCQGQDASHCTLYNKAKLGSPSSECMLPVEFPTS